MDATLERWVVVAAEAAGVPPEVLAGLDPAIVTVVLDLARDAARGVARPAAPLAAFAAGLAAGCSGGPPLATVTAAAARIGAVAATFGQVE